MVVVVVMRGPGSQEVVSVWVVRILHQANVAAFARREIRWGCPSRLTDVEDRKN